MIKLKPPQWTVFNCDTRFRILVAGRRFGKTYLALVELCRSARAARQERWVDDGVAPPKIIATKYKSDMNLGRDPHTTTLRPPSDCPLSGNGNTDDSVNFTCAK